VPRKEFFQEFKDQFQKTLDIKNSLETKANNLLTISGTVGTLLFGFGTFIIEKIAAQYPYTWVVTSILIAGLGATIIALLQAVSAFRLQFYKFPMSHRPFFDINGVLRNPLIEQYKAAGENTFYDTIIETYLRCIKENAEKNEKKARKLITSQYFFIAGVLTIPILAATILLTHPSMR